MCLVKLVQPEWQAAMGGNAHRQAGVWRGNVDRKGEVRAAPHRTARRARSGATDMNVHGPFNCPSAVRFDEMQCAKYSSRRETGNGNVNA